MKLSILINIRIYIKTSVQYVCDLLKSIHEWLKEEPSEIAFYPVLIIALKGFNGLLFTYLFLPDLLLELSRDALEFSIFLLILVIVLSCFKQIVLIIKGKVIFIPTKYKLLYYLLLIPIIYLIIIKKIYILKLIFNNKNCKLK